MVRMTHSFNLFLCESLGSNESIILVGVGEIFGESILVFYIVGSAESGVMFLFCGHIFINYNFFKRESY